MSSTSPYIEVLMSTSGAARLPAVRLPAPSVSTKPVCTGLVVVPGLAGENEKFAV